MASAETGRGAHSESTYEASIRRPGGTSTATTAALKPLDPTVLLGTPTRPYCLHSATAVLGPADSALEVAVSKSSVVCAQVVDAMYYKIIIGVIIIINTVVVIFETDMRAAGIEQPTWVISCSTVFIFIYVLDILVRLYVERQVFLHCFVNVFDLTIVVLDVLMAFLTGAMGDLPSLGLFRGLRMLRLIRVLRQAMVFRELYLMIVGLVSAVKALIFGFSLIFVTLTLWSTIAVDVLNPTNQEIAAEGLYGDCERCERAFVSVLASNLTFMKQILTSDSWGQLSLPLMERNPWTGVVICGAFLTVQLGLVNVIAAMIVDGQAQAREADAHLTLLIKNEELKSSYNRLELLFRSLDYDDSGSLTLHELTHSYDTNPSFRELLDLMDVSRDDMILLFEFLDVDFSGDISYHEFVEQLHKLKNLNKQMLLVFIKHHTTRTRDELGENISKLADHMAEHITRLSNQMTDVVESQSKLLAQSFKCRDVSTMGKSSTVAHSLGDPEASSFMTTLSKSGVIELVHPAGLEGTVEDAMLAEITILRERLDRELTLATADADQRLRLRSTTSLRKVAAESTSTEQLIDTDCKGATTGTGNHSGGLKRLVGCASTDDFGASQFRVNSRDPSNDHRIPSAGFSCGSQKEATEGV